MISLNEKSKLALTKIGWVDSDTCDVSEITNALVEEGYTLSSKLDCVLRRYNRIKFPFKNRRSGSEDFLEIDPLWAIGSVFKGTVDLYVGELGESLIPIGNINSRHMVLMLSESGAIYSGYDDILLKLGEDVHEVFNSLSEQRPPLKKIECDWDDSGD